MEWISGAIFMKFGLAPATQSTLTRLTGVSAKTAQFSPMVE
jgi:hypothetical protein